MSSFSKDVKFAARMLVRSPGFTVVAATTLALGIGANTALFSVIHAVLLRPLPFDEPDQLVLIEESSKRLEKISVAYPNFEDWREQARVFEQMAAHMFDDLNLTGTNMPERLLATRISSNLFPMLGVEPKVGRFFADEEDKVGAERMVVLSHGFWLRRFGKRLDVIGEAINLDGSSHTIIGVAPEGFRYPLRGWVPDIYLTIGNTTGSWRTNRDDHPGIRVTARLAPGTSLEQARAEMTRIARGLEVEYPETNTGLSVHLERLSEAQVKAIRPALAVLTAAVGLVLLIACVNVANLLLARGSARARELAVRTALGAGRARLLRQLLTESVLVSFLGATFGVVLATWSAKLLSLIMPERLAPAYGQIEVDSAVLGFTLFLSVATGLVFGVVPAVLLSKPKLGETLKEGGRGGSVGRIGRGFRNTLVTVEVALALLLLVGTALVLKSFANITTASPGFNPEDILTMEISLPRPKYAERPQRIAFFQELERKVTAIPGIRSAALAYPFLGGWQNGFVATDRPAPPPGEHHMADILSVTPGYFSTMEIPLVKGRTFTVHDQQDTPRVIVIDKTFADTFWPNEDPIGKHVKFARDPTDGAPSLEIVGVVGHVKSYGVDAESRVELYMPYPQYPPISMVLFIKTDAPDTMAAAVRKEVLELDPNQPVHNIRAIESRLADRLVPHRLLLTLISVLGGLALLLATGGIYSVMAYMVSQRSHEFGIRMAMGAQARDILELVLGNGMRLAVIGVGVGLLAAFSVTPFLASQLFGVSARDPWTFAAIPILLLTLAVAASSVPARRATRVAPIVALRHE